MTSHIDLDTNFLTTDDSEILRHLEMMFGNQDRHADGLIEIAYNPPGTTPVNQAKWFATTQLDDATSFAAEQNRNGSNVYVGPALRSPDGAPFGRSSDGDFYVSSVVWMDVDRDWASTKGKLKEADIVPSYGIRTGAIPEERWHLYFELSEPCMDGEALRAANQALQKAFESDSVSNPCRILRLAGTVSYPHPDKIARGYVQEATHLFTWTNAAVHEIQTLIAIASPQVPALLDRPASPQTPIPSDLQKIVEIGVPTGQRSEVFFHAIGWLKDEGWNVDQITDYMRKHSGGIAEKYLKPTNRLHQEVERAFDKCISTTLVPSPNVSAHFNGNGLYFYTLAELRDRPPPQFLIEDLLPERGVAIIGGTSGSMKSFLLICLGMSVALGYDLGNKTTKQSDVLFLLNEGQAGFHTRCNAWATHHCVQDPENIRIAEITPNLMRQETLEPFLALAEDMQFHPGLIVIDTFSKASIGGDDNSTSDMAAAIDTAYRLADHFSALVVLIDHVGKDKKRGIRGAYAKYANVDMVGLVTKSHRCVTLKTVKQKEGEDNLDFEFDVNQVDAVDPASGEIRESVALSFNGELSLPPQKDFIINRLKLLGTISRDQLANEFLGRYGAGKKKSFNEQLRRLTNAKLIVEGDGNVELTQ